MSKITNKSKSTLILGRFKVLPGQSLPAMPYTVREKKDIKHFIEKGMLVTSNGKMPDFLLEKKETVTAVEAPVEVKAAPVSEPVVEPVVEPTPEVVPEVTPEEIPEVAPVNDSESRRAARRNRK